LNIMIKLLWRRTWRPRSSEFGVMHWEDLIERVWKPKRCEFEDGLGCHDQASVEMHMEVIIKRGWTSTWRQSMDGTPCAVSLFIS